MGPDLDDRIEGALVATMFPDVDDLQLEPSLSSDMPNRGQLHLVARQASGSRTAIFRALGTA